MDGEKCLDRRMYDISKMAEVIEIILLSIGIFLVPMILPQILNAVFGATSAITTNSQYIVGTIVNASLIIAGVNIKGWKKLIGLVTLPSISAILSGLVFKTGSIFVVYMIPAIWIGNFVIIYLYKKLFVEKKLNYIIASSVGIITKVAIIFAGFNLLTAINIIPAKSPAATMLYTVMGVNQLITATIRKCSCFRYIENIVQNKEITNNIIIVQKEVLGFFFACTLF